jgi:hypothetical protein
LFAFFWLIPTFSEDGKFWMFTMVSVAGFRSYIERRETGLKLMLFHI